MNETNKLYGLLQGDESMDRNSAGRTGEEYGASGQRGGLVFREGAFSRQRSPEVRGNSAPSRGACKCNAPVGGHM